jgi:hypothetical protein
MLDPGTPAADLDAAEALLGADDARLLRALDEQPPPVMTDLAPDRWGRLARLLPRCAADRSWPKLGPELLGSFRSARFAHEQGERIGAGSLLALRHAHGVLEVMMRLGVGRMLDADDYAWIFTRDEYACPALLPALYEWCTACEPLPARIVEIIKELREEETGLTLDILRAWAAPCPEGMLDLASWENGYRGCFGDDPWRDASHRWEQGERHASDAEVLAPSLDPESSSNFAALKCAIARHRDPALRALREAIEQTPHPILRVLLTAWLSAVGGAS